MALFMTTETEYNCEGRGKLLINYRNISHNSVGPWQLFEFQICRNINRIKVCMEIGRTVILLNLESLYESLYDALNQVSVLKHIY